MSSSKQDPHREDDLSDHSENDMLDADEVADEIIEDNDADAPMSDDEDGIVEGEQQEILLQNDSIAYFDEPKDSLFAIAQHPVHPSLVAVGGAEGEEEDAPGAGYVFDTSAAQGKPVLPPSFASDPQNSQQQQSTELKSLYKIEGHTDSINALAWTYPQGEALVSAGMDGRLRAYKADVRPGEGINMTFLAETQEVPEINWLANCPSAENPNTVALGASDGSVWVYTVDPTDTSGNALQIVQSYFLHSMPSTAGAWTPDGKLLCTISEDSSLYVWDVWGEAAAQNITAENGMSVVALTADDQRFEVEGGLYSIAVDPKGGYVAVGGAGGAIKIVSLPRLTAQTQSQSQARGKNAGKMSSDPTSGGVILASLHTQTDSIETLTFGAPTATAQPTTLLAAGSVDGSIVVYDATRRFAVRRNMQSCHEGHSIVKLEFVRNSWLLTSCGMDGVVRRWDLRGGGVTGNNQAGAADAGLVKEFKGHRGDGEGGGVLGFVQGETGERIITAGDDSVALVFEA